MKPETCSSRTRLEELPGSNGVLRQICDTSLLTALTFPNGGRSVPGARTAARPPALRPEHAHFTPASLPGLSGPPHPPTPRLASGFLHPGPASWRRPRRQHYDTRSLGSGKVCVIGGVCQAQAGTQCLSPQHSAAPQDPIDPAGSRAIHGGPGASSEQSSGSCSCRPR